jgi:hypothetical protein
MANIKVSYDLNKFMEFKDKNMMLPFNLKPICNEYGGTLIIRDILLKEVASVIDNFNSGKNPNDIIFKNLVIENLNKINQKNYATIIESLKNLSYNKHDHFVTLSSDLLLRAMTDTTAIKGVEMPAGQKSLSELYTDIVVEFSQLSIKENNKDIKFINVFMEHCQRYFSDFIDPTKILDSNNQYRVDNFKGFMNFLGLLFCTHILSHKIVNLCLSKLRDLMTTKYWTEWGQSECENVYDGYKKLVHYVVVNYNKTSELKDSDKEFIKSILSIHNNVKEINEKTNKLRKFTMMAHKDLETKLTKLIN